MSKPQEGSAGQGAARGTGGTGRRPRGRPRLDIEPDAVADAVAQIFAESGFDAVSISATAERLAVSRATLYRTVPGKEHLLAILFERSADRMQKEAEEIIAGPGDAADRLSRLVRMQIASAVRMRKSLPMFFEDMDLPPDMQERWRVWRRRYERTWQNLVSEAIDEGVVDGADPVLATRLIFGMCLWVSQWYRSGERYDADEISNAAVRIILAGGG